MSGLLFFAINCSPLMEPMSSKGGMKWNDNTWNNLCMYWPGADCTGQMRTEREIREIGSPLYFRNKILSFNGNMILKNSKEDLS